MKELNHKRKNENLKNVENILDDMDSFKPIINPCYGDPVNRDVLKGGFINENAFVKYDDIYKHENGDNFYVAGPRLHIALDPSEVNVMIVTCGGLCPGLNVVVRELVLSLWYNYGVRNIFGIKWGYGGIYKEECWIKLDSSIVKDIHTLGGTILGTSRGGFDADKICNTLEKKKINMIFSIGGDGTHRGILALCQEIKNRKLKIVVAGIPKTIDNDIPLIDRSFGFVSSIEQAVKVVQCANVEATCVENGVGLVKLFGRSCGFIALDTTLASRDVNICLIPEAKFDLYGDKGFLKFLMKRLKEKSHCVVVVAEGSASAIQDLDVSETGRTDNSGNPILPDIGFILKDEISKYAKKEGIEITLKYIDPTYIIRSCPANSFDTNYCA